MDEELITLGENSRDCIISSCALHWVNDLPGTFVQIRNALKPDGVFLCAMIGGETLFELRSVFALTWLMHWLRELSRWRCRTGRRCSLLSSRGKAASPLESRR